MLQLMREKVDIRLRIGHDGVNPEPHIVRAFLAARRCLPPINLHISPVISKEFLHCVLSLYSNRMHAAFGQLSGLFYLNTFV